ncbi:MAG TPA: L,D-transpeptidase [Microvirga sp.]|nr:L,D-transpeptidase [Microvirga sp.]
MRAWIGNAAHEQQSVLIRPKPGPVKLCLPLLVAAFGAIPEKKHGSAFASTVSPSAHVPSAGAHDQSLDQGSGSRNSKELAHLDEASRLHPAGLYAPSQSKLESAGERYDELIAMQVSKITQSIYTPPQVRTFGRPRQAGTIFIRNSERRLFYFIDNHFAIEFPVGIGRGRLAKTGRTKITDKRRDPVWVPTKNQRRVYRGLPAFMPAGPDNPLGSRALNLTIPNYRIHGTNQEWSVGLAASDGCFRMYNRDIEFLFDLVSIGTQVVIER